MAVHFSPWLLLLVSTAFMASYMLASAAECNCGNPGSCANPGGVSAASQSGTTYTYGAMVSYTCNTGYEMTAGGNPLTCSNNKTWIGTKPTCSKVICPNPGNVSASFRSGTTYTYGAKVTYTCNTGYEMTAGEPTLTCNSSKAWNGTKPTCSKVICPNPGNSNATFQSGTTYTYGARVTYTCITGYELSTLTCDSNRKWIGTKPNCSNTYKRGNKIGDCADLYKKGVRQNGVYQIHILSGAHANQAVSVYCDMQSDGGGWTVFQRRVDGSVDFNRNWDNYTDGFGNVDGEYWLGLETIHALTADTPQLRVDLWDWDGNTEYALCPTVSVGDSRSNYKMQLKSYCNKGSKHNIGGHLYYIQHDKAFSTYDKDNDPDVHRNCASKLHAGWWWYQDCLPYNNLNGKYVSYKKRTAGDRFMWYDWTHSTKNSMQTLKAAEMKLRPSNFKSG